MSKASRRAHRLAKQGADVEQRAAQWGLSAGDEAFAATSVRHVSHIRSEACAGFSPTMGYLPAVKLTFTTYAADNFGDVATTTMMITGEENLTSFVSDLVAIADQARLDVAAGITRP